MQAHPAGLPCRELTELPLPVSSRALRLAAGTQLSETHVAAALELAKGEGTGLSGPARAALEARAGAAELRRGGCRAPAVRELVIGGDTEIPEAGVILHSALTVYSGEIHSSLNTFFFQYENICGTITCTPRAAGDKIRLQGRGCTKKLSDLFAERHLTQAERELVRSSGMRRDR